MTSRTLVITLTARDDGSVHYTFVDNDGNAKSSALYVGPNASVGDRLCERIRLELGTSDLILEQERPSNWCRFVPGFGGL